MTTTNEVMRLADWYANANPVIAVSDREALRTAVEALVAERDALKAALQRVVDSEEAHSTIHASDGDDIARMIEWAEAFDAARAALKGKP